jgi:(p)ppGpp synthase/HD superfamily hydrolase
MNGMTEELFSPLVERAMRVASCRHRGHNRKDSDLPYISHPASVALILRKAGFNDEQVLAAALLHDVVEDTEYSRESLAAEFPARVVEYVLALRTQTG